MNSQLKIYKDIIEDGKHKSIFLNNGLEKIYWLSKEDIDSLKDKINIIYIYNDITSKYKDFVCEDDV